MVATKNRAAKLIALLGVAILLLAILAPAATASEELTFVLTPYVWLPTLEGDLKYTTLPNGSSGSPEIKVDPEDLLDNLDMGALLTAEIRKGKWSFVADFTYLDVSSSDSEVKKIDFGGHVVDTNLDVDTEVDVKSVCSTFGVGYNLVSGDRLKTDMILGARYLWVEADTDWELSASVSGPDRERTFARAGSVEEDEEFWNGIVGFRGDLKLGESNWSIPYYADIGTGDCDSTWQLFAALAYSFESWEAIFGYRHMEFEGDDDNLVQKLKFSGPILGVRFAF